MYTDYINFSKPDELVQISVIDEEEEIELDSSIELRIPKLKSDALKA